MFALKNVLDLEVFFVVAKLSMFKSQPGLAVHLENKLQVLYSKPRPKPTEPRLELKLNNQLDQKKCLISIFAR
jgi:hypothetical protein